MASVGRFSLYGKGAGHHGNHEFIHSTACGQLVRVDRTRLSIAGSACLLAGRRRRHVDDWHVESKYRSPPRKKFGGADNIERWQVKLGASPPDPQREIGTDPGRLAER